MVTLTTWFEGSKDKLNNDNADRLAVPLPFPIPPFSLSMVVLSRVKTLTGLHIVNFEANVIRKSSLVDDEMSRLRTKLLQSVQPLQCFPCTSHVTIALLNVRSIRAKLADIKADIELLSADVLCF